MPYGHVVPRNGGRRLIGARLAGLGAAGVVLGHTLAYFAVAPVGHDRASLLSATGHSYWQAAVVAALVAAVASLGAHAVTQFRASRARQAFDGSVESITRAGVRLAAFQIVVYALMEAAERFTAHEPVASMFSQHLFLIAVMLQVAVAAVLVQVLRFVGRAAAAMAKKLAPPAHPARVVAWHPVLEPYARSLSAWSRPGPSRAPPALA